MGLLWHRVRRVRGVHRAAVQPGRAPHGLRQHGHRRRNARPHPQGSLPGVAATHHGGGRVPAVAANRRHPAGVPLLRIPLYQDWPAHRHRRDTGGHRAGPVAAGARVAGGVRLPVLTRLAGQHLHPEPGGAGAVHVHHRAGTGPRLAAQQAGADVRHQQREHHHPVLRRHAAVILHLRGVRRRAHLVPLLLALHRHFHEHWWSCCWW